MIFDFLRQRYVALTPEEWVRQQFTHYLVDYKGYSPMLMGNEITLNIGRLSRRCDTVVFNSSASPLMIIEYKAPMVRITQKVFEQISAYNIAFHARYLTVSNGIESYCCCIGDDNSSFSFLDEIPAFPDIMT